MNKNNIIISSKNREDKNNSPSFISINLDTPLKCSDNEYFTVNINSFNMVKSFYQIQTNLNSIFYIILKHQTDPDDVNEYMRSIPSGNYTVSSLLTTLKELSFELLNVEYNKTLNKFLFKRDISNVNTIGYDLYLKCINTGNILGFKNNEELLITEEGLLSDTFVNISGYSSLLIKIDGISINNSYTNLNDSKYDINKVLAIIDIASVKPMDSILYNCNNYNEFRISDKIIKQFSINIINEDGVEFPQMSDYILDIVFKKNKNETDINLMFNTFMVRFNDLIFYISYLFQYLGVAGENV